MNITKQMVEDVKKKISIPMYFYNIIVPQLGNYYSNYPVDFDNKVVVCCPLHDEDTPSFRYYVETNSFYCFGCQKGGDVVQLHRYFAEKLNGVMPSRDDAIAFLYGYFIKGKEQDTFIVYESINKEKINSNSELIRLNRYRFNLEQSISYDNNISLSIKKELWRVLDDIDLLLSTNTLKAKDAETYIKNRVKELVK